MAEREKQGLFSNTVRIMEERLYLQWQQKTKKGKSGSKLQWSWVLTLHREAVSEEDRCPPPTPYLTYHPGSSGFLASSTFSGNSCLSSHVTLTPAQLPEKARLYLQTVLPDPGLRRRRHQKRIPLPVPLPFKASRFLNKVMLSPRAPGGPHQRPPLTYALRRHEGKPTPSDGAGAAGTLQTSVESLQTTHHKWKQCRRPKGLCYSKQKDPKSWFLPLATTVTVRRTPSTGLLLL